MIPRPALASDLMTRQRGVVIDDPYGNEIIDWTNPETLDVIGSVQPVKSAEWLVNRDGLESQWTAYVWPPDADITRHDRIVYAGRTYEVAGDVHAWTIAGQRDHIELALTVWEG